MCTHLSARSSAPKDMPLSLSDWIEYNYLTVNILKIDSHEDDEMPATMLSVPTLKMQQGFLLWTGASVGTVPMKHWALLGNA